MIEREEDLHPLQKLAVQDMSYSRINTFEWCQLKYYYAYVLKYPQVFGPPAILGNIIHKALEDTLEDGEEIDKLALLQNYRMAIPYYDPDRNIPQEMIDEGESMLVEFVNTNVGVQSIHQKEMPFSFILDGTRLNGYIDVVELDEKDVKIRDYKSGKRMITKKETPNNFQLGIYSLYLKLIYPDKGIYSELYYLRNGSIRGHRYTEGELDELQEKIAAKINEILTTEDFKATPNEYSCKWCSYAEDGTCAVGAGRLRKFAERNY